MDIKKALHKKAQTVDLALGRVLPNGTTYPKHLAQAMRYSVFSGGKRVRPFLVLESAKLCGSTAVQAMPLACAVEIIHAYSLVHDDLPAMDNDDFRRGKKTCHRAFDEATAILAGDALLTLAFQVLSRAKGIPEARIQKVIQVVSQAIGTHGMVGGQAADLKFNEKKTTLTDLNRINRLKTGALITACCEGGAIWAGATQSERLHARKYGETVGFLFQLVDDIIDGDGYASMVGKEAAFKKAATIRDKAKRELRTFGKKAETLLSFCDFLYERKH